MVNINNNPNPQSDDFNVNNNPNPQSDDLNVNNNPNPQSDDPDPIDEVTVHHVRCVNRSALFNAAHQMLTEKFSSPPFRVGSRVRCTQPESEIVSEYMRKYGTSRPEAIGIAHILCNEPLEVVGIQSLTDDKNLPHPALSVMTRDGYMYLLWASSAELISDDA